MEPSLIMRGSFIDVSMVKELLEEKGIPCLMRSDHGAGFVIQTGGLLEDYYLYVAQGDEHKAVALRESIGK